MTLVERFLRERRARVSVETEHEPHVVPDHVFWEGEVIKPF